MAQGLHLSQRPTLSQVLAPQLQQSLVLLQAPVLELKALVEQELQQNPVLEEVPPAELERLEQVQNGEKADATLDPAEPPADVKFDPAEEKPTSTPVDDFQAEFERLAQMDQEWRDHFSQTNLPLRTEEEEQEKRQFMFDSLTSSPSLQADLLEQVRMSDLDRDQWPIAELIIGNMDEYGYLKTPIEELALTHNLPAEEVLAVLKVIQTFDPPGVGARDLRECLLLQLERAGQKNSIEYRIVSEHMPALAKRRVPEIAKALGLTVEQAQEAMERISRLEPRPGRAYLPDDDQYVVPEVFVRKVGDDFVVTTNNDQIPHLRISNTYKDLMARSAVDLAALEKSLESAPAPVRQRVSAVAQALNTGNDAGALAELRQLAEQPDLTREQKQAVHLAMAQVQEKQAFIEARNYIREKIRAGKFLIKSLDQRQQTILNIAREIVKRQREFMEKGVAYLKPMTMVQIAEAVGVHETTVSRAVSGKYMDTPQGLFEMKYFFTAGIQTADGTDVSNKSVKDMIAEIFRKEDPSKPLSDQEVVQMLAERGVKIARRTVAKYRMELGILPSNLRKVY